MDTLTHKATKDGQTKFTGSADQCWEYILKHQPHSVDHATTYEGWAIEPQTLRDQYRNGDLSFAEYYQALAKRAGVKVTDQALIQRAEKALNAGDEHLNTIPLETWDMRAMSLLPSVDTAIREAGEQPTLAVKVCLLKQSARNAVEAQIY